MGYLTIKIRNSNIMEGAKVINLRIGRISKLIFSNYGYCRKCHTTWNLVENKVVFYNSNSGCFALCQKCWNNSSKDERLHHYKSKMYSWGDSVSKGDLQTLTDNIMR